MATYRNKDESALTTVKPPTIYNLGNKPPLINWTIVTGDSAAFRIYVEDDLGAPITIGSWTIKAQFRRYSDNVGDDLIFTLIPAATNLDGSGEFTVFLTPAQSKQLVTGDVFDVQLSDATRVWTVCQGEMVMIGEVTDQES
jgi:hypothetical protein